MSEAREELARAEAEKASVAAAADAAASKAKAAAAEAASSDSQATAHAAAAKQVKASHAELEEEHNALQGRVSAILEQAKQAKQAAEKLEKSLDECKKERTKALEGERTAVNAAAALREAAEAEKAARLAAEANDSAGQQTQLQELMEEGHALAIRKDAAHKSELSRLEEELKSATAKADTSASELESKSKAATRQEAALREDAARVQALLDQLGAEHERELAEAHAMLSESGDEKLRDAVQQLERSQAEKAALGKQAEVAERSAEGASRALASLQSDHSRVLSSNSALTAECKTYREEVAAKAKQVAELTSEVDALNAKVRKKAEEVQTQISARKDRIAIMTADYTKLEKSWKLSRDFEQTFLNAQLSDKEILKMVKDHVRAMSHGEP
jgi:chromosome segregation ATPase